MGSGYKPCEKKELAAYARHTLKMERWLKEQQNKGQQTVGADR